MEIMENHVLEELVVVLGVMVEEHHIMKVGMVKDPVEKHLEKVKLQVVAGGLDLHEVLGV